ncbi:MAG TPA: histidine phosphatase family protein [Microbacteriaceae bacterium]|nr:histidine phosphatase family protein [Microbacteriaceae bacterium]
MLARHGETDWNREHRWRGVQGPSLNRAGRVQARVLARRVRILLGGKG